jgi:hypothetical protein
MSWNGNKFAPPDDSSCVLYLPGHPGVGTTITDFSGQGNHGTITGATWVKLPSRLWVQSFNGLTNLITITDAPSFNITATLTVLTWVTSTDITAARQYILSKYNTTGNQREWAIIKEQLNGKFFVAFGDPVDGTLEGEQLSDSAYLVNNIWNHLGFTFSSGTCVLYANGQAVASTVITGAVPATLFNGTSNVKVGATGADASLWGGKIGLPRIFSSALTAPQIANIYQQERYLFGV